MELQDIGFNDDLEKIRIENQQDGFETGRVIIEHKERYLVKTIGGEFEAEITGHIRFTARSREDFPAVGDWVLLGIYDSGFALIHKVLPRYSVIRRQAVGQYGEVQVIAANIDYAFIVQAADRDFNINRLERYLTIVHSSNISPVIVLTKIDLIGPSRINEIISSIKARIENVPVLAISNENQEGYETLKGFIQKGKTYCLLGSSGVGKSTMLNNLSGRAVMKTGTVSQSTSKGMHVTSHRELIILENGGILIDNPGMREVGLADATGGLEATFDLIFTLSRDCKFMDCTHAGESGCRVVHAVETGELDRASYDNYLKMNREKAHFESTVAERRKKDKGFGKMMKNYKKEMNKK